MRKPAGQTLVEVLLALTIIIVGMISLVTALINTQSTATASLEDTVAVQLAREALEAARFRRDSNWLERENGLGTDFNTGLMSSVETSDYSGIYLWDQTQLTDPGLAIQFDFGVDVSTDTRTAVYQNSPGLYRQFTAAPSAAWTVTPYHRFVTFYPICSSDGGVVEQVVTADGTDCNTAYTGTTQIGVQVQVTVTWISRGNTHSRVLEERIYDWRYAQS